VIGDILQPTHLLFVLVIALLVLGPKRLPEVGRSLGRGLRDFRSALSGDEHEHVDGASVPTTAPAPTAAPAPTPTSAEPATAAEHAEPVSPAEPVAEPVEHIG
jgi:sec-independent protein translocase protein TatA